MIRSLMVRPIGFSVPGLRHADEPGWPCRRLSSVRVDYRSPTVRRLCLLARGIGVAGGRESPERYAPGGPAASPLRPDGKESVFGASIPRSIDERSPRD